MNKPTHRTLTPPCILESGDEYYEGIEWKPVNVTSINGKEIHFQNTCRRPIDENGDDVINKVREEEHDPDFEVLEADEKVSEDMFEQAWQHIETCKTIPGKNIPVPVADGNKNVCPYFAYVDDTGQWVHAHTKQAQSPTWWLCRWPEFPGIQPNGYGKTSDSDKSRLKDLIDDKMKDMSEGMAAAKVEYLKTLVSGEGVKKESTNVRLRKLKITELIYAVECIGNELKALPDE